MDSIAELLAFVRTAETSSFVGAARSLGLSPSTVGKRVARLEQDLGVRLFQRTTRRVRLTEAGERLLERCRRALEELSEARADLAQRQHSPSGLLRVGLPTIGYRFLLPVLPLFAQRYPDVQLELDFNDRLVDVVSEGLDVVIRSGELADSSLMARRLGPFHFLLCAAPAHLRTHAPPATLAQLGAHPAVRFRFPTTGKLQPWTLPGHAGDAGAPLTTVMTCNNMEALLAAAIGGMGVAWMPDFLAAEALADGRLQELLPDHPRQPGQFSLLWPGSRQPGARLRVFIDFMAEHLFNAAPPLTPSRRRR
ncbi:LysR family transcriptional regulator [Stenotrophomonas rhizophila]|uniref:LysR family transcriptional regulator n=1 Tax=Stenotrophomonas rhizophila TaxID=216778 RepID=UPI001E591CA4|nr:LysR family transcriptional regulator [Stenotrophomonas rhizophila]MCC7635114.1 LysR family transcriptional regulator [Stenotrophomonas rhizophila]MCC7664870.1 LysR family transcriptional regulator [Stenotrophomonas rhizophila]